MQIHEFSQDQQIYDQASQHLFDLITQSTQPTLLLLSGGSAIKSYTVIVDAIKADQSSHVTLGLVDERYGPTDHPHSNAKAIGDQTGLWQACENHGVAYTLPLSNLPLAETAQNYQSWLGQTISSVERIILILGMGLDGHTAGIFPQDEPSFNRLFASEEQLFVGYSSNTEHDQRLTITFPVIQQASDIILIAAGQDKRTVFDQAQSTPKDQTHKAPISFIQKLPQTTACISQQ